MPICMFIFEDVSLSKNPPKFQEHILNQLKTLKWTRALQVTFRFPAYQMSIAQQSLPLKRISLVCLLASFLYLMICSISVTHYNFFTAALPLASRRVFIWYLFSCLKSIYIQKHICMCCGCYFVVTLSPRCQLEATLQHIEN